MDFIELVSSNLGPVLQGYGFRVDKKVLNYITYKSQSVQIFLCYDERDHSYEVSVGKVNGHLWSLSPDNIEYLFGPGLKVDFSSPSAYVMWFSALFEGLGKQLITGNTRLLDVWDDYMTEKSRVYLADLLHRQSMKVIDEAWKNHNYPDFISSMNKIDKVKWSEADRLKYKIANRKVEEK